jgi:XapX domain-containing protein
MLPYALSAGVGLAVGVAYALLGVRSPAPPIIALLGLLGMLMGETAVNWVKGHPEIWSWACQSKTFVAEKAGAPTTPPPPAPSARPPSPTQTA